MGEVVRPDTQPSSPAPPSTPAPCRTCEEWRLAEAVADAERDFSRATDCRVLLRRHQETADCSGQGPA
ncbi:hypothetical protein [Streptomyces sp. NPDC007088]|uniref:hypothetical protein n=1 Tax=Streptomyces sp. NPDC007088 TaxID=3364773 RepID=UPI00369A98F9